MMTVLLILAAIGGAGVGGWYAGRACQRAEQKARRVLARLSRVNWGSQLNSSMDSMDSNLRERFAGESAE